MSEQNPFNDKNIGKLASRCVWAMAQGDMPTYAEFKAAWAKGLIDATSKGNQVIRQINAIKLVGPVKPETR